MSLNMDSVYSNLKIVLQSLLNKKLFFNITKIHDEDLSLNTVLIDLPQKLRIAEIKDHNLGLIRCRTIFPTVFNPSRINTLLKANITNKVRLKLAGIPFFIATNKNIVFSTYSFSPLILHLQIVQYLISNSKYPINEGIRFSGIKKIYDYFEDNIAIYNYDEMSSTSLSLWLSNQIREHFSFGELIDFIDHLYDQYKITQISPHCFHIIFKCFGQNTIEIGNSAFDYFSQFRNSYMAWEKSICSFLCNELYFSEGFAMSIAQKLLKNLN